MVRYYFHIIDDLVTTDEEGKELADGEAARRHAVRCARELMCEQLRAGLLNLNHRIEVQDQDRRPVMQLPYSDAVAIVSPPPRA